MTLLPFNLLPGFEPLVKEGDTVKEGDILAENKTPSEISINIASDLGIPIRKVRNALKKNSGDSVSQGDILAEKKGIMGGKMIKSTITGVFSRIDEETGSMIIKTGDTNSQDKIVAPVDGVVTMVGEGRILVKTEKEALAAEKFSGDTFSGEVEVLNYLHVRDIDAKIAGKVIMIEKLDRENLAKLIGLDVGAVITVEVPEEELANLKSKDIRTPVLKVTEKEFSSFSKSAHKILVDGQKGVALKI